MTTSAMVATAGVITAIAGGGVYAWGQGWIPGAPVFPSSDPVYTLYMPIGLVAAGILATFVSIRGA